jgi:tRNA A37 threonylcarbamoyladenosine dehydratase
MNFSAWPVERSTSLPPSADLPDEIDDRFAPLGETSALAGPALERWRNAELVFVGAGQLNSRLALEAVRSGASAWIIDFDHVETSNLALQSYDRAGPCKALALRDACNAIRPHATTATVGDVRHVGIGEFLGRDLILDGTDDAGLAPWLTEVSNGLGIPLVRLAVDGSGEAELGRVLVSDGGNAHACQQCPKTLEQVLRRRVRIPCPGADPARRAATRSGNAVAMAVAGLGLLQAQRIVGGNHADRAFDRHLVLDLDNGRMHSLIEVRNDGCLSGHVRWSLARVPLEADQASLEEVFRAADEVLGEPACLELYGHGLCLGASCACGHLAAAAGTRWLAPPACALCGQAMEWQPHTRLERWTRRAAAAAGILERTPASLGLPRRGAMFVALGSSRPPARFVLA